MSCFLTNSSLGKKLVMSLTGCFLVLFILFHMSMNLVAIISPEGYNTICAFLGANWYALAGTGGAGRRRADSFRLRPCGSPTTTTRRAASSVTR